MNCCSICSKKASSSVSYWSNSRIRNVVFALKYITPRKEKPLICWDRDNHRSGVIFSYLDNDVGNYFNLYDFIDICYRELGVKTRISTVGYSRFNDELNKMHKKIANYYDALGGVRLSLTPYEIGWCSNQKKFSQEDYTKDIANFLKIYKPYYNHQGSGYREFCVELRYKPLVINKDVYIFRYKKHFIICSSNYLYVSVNENIKFINTVIKDVNCHKLSLNNDGIKFNKIKCDIEFNSKQDIIKYLNKNNYIEKEVTIYKVHNIDGYYYGINPKLTSKGNDGLYIYPRTKMRLKSGIVIVERYFLNQLLNYDKKTNITFDDCNKVLNNMINDSLKYKNTINNYIYEYVNNEIYPLVNSYKNALIESGYSPSLFFDKSFTIDTGIICNLGRAISEFKGLVSRENEPLTLNHERNYGKINSKMINEGIAWRLSADYNDKIIIQKLNLSSTASKKGQVSFEKIIQLNENDYKLNFNDINNNYLIPGQVKVDKNE